MPTQQHTLCTQQAAAASSWELGCFCHRCYRPALEAHPCGATSIHGVPYGGQLGRNFHFFARPLEASNQAQAPDSSRGRSFFSFLHRNRNSGVVQQARRGGRLAPVGATARRNDDNNKARPSNGRPWVAQLRRAAFCQKLAPAHLGAVAAKVGSVVRQLVDRERRAHTREHYPVRCLQNVSWDWASVAAASRPESAFCYFSFVQENFGGASKSPACVSVVELDL